MKEHELGVQQYINREYAIVHDPIEKEFEFYDYVKKGDIENVRRTMTPLAYGNVGKLSDDRIRHLRYHLIVTIALITRYCIEGGMESEKAYTLSDLYINMADKAVTEKQLRDIHKEAIFDFTGKMKAHLKERIYSKPVAMAMDYIYDHLHERITTEDLAEHTGLSVSYISRLFHKITGVTVSEYIMQKRVEAAENMLRFTDYSASHIANVLAFSSHSHFISIFKKHTGMTPNRYREKYYRRSEVIARS